MTLRKNGVLFFSIFVVLFWASPSVGETSLEDIVRQLQDRMEILEKKVAKQDGYIQSQKAVIQSQQNRIFEYENKLSRMDADLRRETGEPGGLMGGLELGVGGTVIAQGADDVHYDGDGNTLKDSRTDGSYSADITLGKEWKGIDGKVLLHLEAGQGAGLEDHLVLYSNVNRDSGDSDAKVEVTEFWYEQALFEDKAAVTFGKLDPTAYFDINEVANDETAQFLGRIFRNSPTIEFPDNAAGIRLAYLPVEWLELGYGVFDGNGDWENVGDYLFNIGQIAFKTEFFGRPGHYRLLGWQSHVYHTKWLETSKEKEAAYGFGLSFDQKLTDRTTAFCRYGWQDPEVYNPDIMTTGDHNFSLEQSWSAGLQFEGKPWGREQDVLAFAVGQVFPSDDYQKAGSSTVATPHAKAEGHGEVYYRIFVNDHLSISPDFQYILNPFGKDVGEDTSPIFIGGMRTQIDF